MPGVAPPSSWNPPSGVDPPSPFLGIHTRTPHPPPPPLPSDPPHLSPPPAGNFTPGSAPASRVESASNAPSRPLVPKGGAPLPQAPHPRTPGPAEAPRAPPAQPAGATQGEVPQRGALAAREGEPGVLRAGQAAPAARGHLQPAGQGVGRAALRHLPPPAPLRRARGAALGAASHRAPRRPR